MKNLLDPSQITNFTNLAKQMYPRNVKSLVQAYDYATKQPYNYLLIHHNQYTDNCFWLHSNIFPSEYTRVYQQKHD